MQTGPVFVRTKQQEFRRILLSQYKKRCVFCGFACEEYMTAAHIVPYSVMRRDHPEDAMSPVDGLLLCRLCDTAFETGSVILEPDYRITVMPKLGMVENRPVRSWVGNISKVMDPGDVEYAPSETYIARKKELVCNI